MAIETELERTRIEFLLLADRAEAIGGKLYIMGGGWDRITPEDISQPLTISVAVGILVPRSQASDIQTITATIEDMDGSELVRTQAAFSVTGTPIVPPDQRLRTLVTVPELHIIFPRPGGYRLRATIATDQRDVVFAVVDAKAGQA